LYVLGCHIVLPHRTLTPRTFIVLDFKPEAAAICSVVAAVTIPMMCTDNKDNCARDGFLAKAMIVDGA
jgi:hypothetical protein